MQGKQVIVRTYSAGVHFGTLSSAPGKEITLTNARRIWYWTEAFTLSAVAQNGVGKDSKISVAIPEIYITEAIEIIPVSEKAGVQLTEIKAHE
jgi:hypothetical protein